MWCVKHLSYKYGSNLHQPSPDKLHECIKLTNVKWENKCLGIGYNCKVTLHINDNYTWSRSGLWERKNKNSHEIYAVPTPNTKTIFFSCVVKWPPVLHVNYA